MKILPFVTFDKNLRKITKAPPPRRQTLVTFLFNLSLVLSSLTQIGFSAVTIISQILLEATHGIILSQLSVTHSIFPTELLSCFCKTSCNFVSQTHKKVFLFSLYTMIEESRDVKLCVSSFWFSFLSKLQRRRLKFGCKGYFFV